MKSQIRRHSVAMAAAIVAVLAVAAAVFVNSGDADPAGRSPVAGELLRVDPEDLPSQQEAGTPGQAPPEDADAQPLPPQNPPAETEEEALERAIEMAGVVTHRQVVGDRGCHRATAGALAADIDARFEAGEIQWKEVSFEKVPSAVQIWLCVVEIDGYDGLSTMVIHAEEPSRDLEFAFIGTVPSFLNLTD